MSLTKGGSLSLAAGSRLGPYEITAKIGQGGMGEVYRAKDAKLGRHVALKILPEAFAADPDRLVRFQREAQVLASLNHPNIAAIYGVEEGPAVRSSGLQPREPGPHVRALVMELVEGPSVSKVCRMVDGNRAMTPLPGSPLGRISPDGRWVAYQSSESGRDEIYVQAFPSLEGKWQVSTGGGTEPVWSRQGDELFYRGQGSFSAVRVSADGSFLPGPPQRLFEDRFHVQNGHTNYDVSSDGRRFLVVKNAPSTQHIIVIESWLDELKRLVPVS